MAILLWLQVLTKGDSMGFVSFGNNNGDNKTLVGLIERNLTDITIPKGVTVLGPFAFAGCDKLIGINIPNNITTIGRNAFNYCRSLTSITIPDSIDILAADLFASCVSLKCLIMPSKKVIALTGVGALNDTPISKNKGGYIYVPKVLIEDYKVATNWVTYAEQFRAIEEYPEVLEVNSND